MNGNKRKLIIADNPEILEIINTTSQTMTTDMPVIKSIPNIAPNDVATCLLYTSPSPRDLSTSRMPSSA